MKEKEILKPRSLAMQDAKTDIINAIGKTLEINPLSYFDLEIILGQIYSDIAVESKRQIENERETYNKALEEKNKERKSEKK